LTTFEAIASTTGLSLLGKIATPRIAILEQEANLAALNRPQHLTILAGDSLSDWFPDYYPQSELG